MFGRQGKPDPNFRIGQRNAGADRAADRAMLKVAGIVACVFVVLVIWAWLN
jgi:hypothetical protein